MTKQNETIHVQMTKLEANAVLRVLATGNDTILRTHLDDGVKDKQGRMDTDAATWVAKRILGLLEGNCEEER